MFVALKGFPRLEAEVPLEASPLPSVDVDRRSVEPLKLLKRFVEPYEGRVLLVAESPGRRETLSQFFAEHDFHPVLVDDW